MAEEEIADELIAVAPDGPDGPEPEPALQQLEQLLQREQRGRGRTNGNKAARTKRQNVKSANPWGKRPDNEMKPNVVVDEMFPEGAGPYMDIDEAGGSSGLLMDLAANEKSVHTDFFNQFDDLYDDEDLS